MQESIFKEKPSEKTLRDFYYLVFRYKKSLITFFIAVMVLVLLGTLIMPNIYRSDSKLLVRIGSESISMDPTAPKGQGSITISQNRQNELNSEMEILTSQELAEKVVDAIGVNAIVRGKSLDEEKSPSSSTPKETKTRKKAVQILMENLNVEVVKNSNIILLSYEAKDPKLASDVLSKLIDLYLNKHIKVHRTEGSYKFFEQQKDLLNKDLAETENIIKDIKNQNYIGSLQAQMPFILDRIAFLKKEINSTEYDIAVSNAKVDVLQVTYDIMPERLITEEITGGALSASDEMRTRLNELQLKEQEILATYTEDSIFTQEIRRQIREAKRILSEVIDAKQVTEGLNEERQKIHLELTGEKAILSSLKAKAKTLQEQIVNSQAELRRINEAEALLSQLDRDREVQEFNYRKYSRDLEQARIDQVRELERISNIKVFQAPTFPLKPIRPKPLLNLFLGLCLGIFGGLGYVLFANYLDHSFKKPEDIEEKLNIPALGAIPFLYREGAEKESALPIRFDSSSEVKRHCEILLERLLIPSRVTTEPRRIFSITSCYKGEGISTVSAYLASVLAEHSDGRVLLVDANLPNPMVHRFFDVDQSPGLADILVGGQSLTAIIQPSPVSNLDLLCAGKWDISGKARLFESKAFTDMLNYWKNEYSFVVLDTPAVWEENHAVTLGGIVDGVILVVEAESVRWEVALWAKERLTKGGTNLIGGILNKRRFYVPSWLYKTL